MNCDIDIFIDGFTLASKIIIQKYNAKYLLIENISDNHYILEQILKITKPFTISPTALFLYNYAAYPLKSREVFAIY